MGLRGIRLYRRLYDMGVLPPPVALWLLLSSRLPISAIFVSECSELVRLALVPSGLIIPSESDLKRIGTLKQCIFWFMVYLMSPWW